MKEAVITAGAIDVHSHVVPDELPFNLGGDSRWLRLDRQNGHVMRGQDVFRVVKQSSWDFEQRITDMDANDISVQVVSPMPELFAYWAPADLGLRHCIAVNKWIAERCQSAPGRFLGFGILPLQDCTAALEALEQIADLGLAGIEVGTNVQGIPLTDARFYPVLEAAAERQLPVFVHAFRPTAGEYVDSLFRSAVTFPLEIGFIVAALISNGTIAQLPQLRLCASHGGGGCFASIARMQYQWTTKSAVQAQFPDSPEDLVHRLWFDTLVFDPKGLSTLMAYTGVDRIVIGSDYPFQDGPPGWPLHNEDNVEELFASTRRAACEYLGVS